MGESFRWSRWIDGIWSPSQWVPAVAEAGHRCGKWSPFCVSNGRRRAGSTISTTTAMGAVAAVVVVGIKRQQTLHQQCAPSRQPTLLGAFRSPRPPSLVHKSEATRSRQERKRPSTCLLLPSGTSHLGPPSNTTHLQTLFFFALDSEYSGYAHTRLLYNSRRNGGSSCTALHRVYRCRRIPVSAQTRPQARTHTANGGACMHPCMHAFPSARCQPSRNIPCIR